LPLGEADQARASAAPHKPSRPRKLLYGAFYGLGAFLVPVSFLAAILPGMMMLNELWVNTPGYFGYLWAVPFAALSYIILLALEILAAKWLLLGRVKPGTYDTHTGFYFRKWFIDQFMEVSLDLLAPLYATLYLNPWYRALGARLGSRAEISTAGAATPDLLSIGEEAFIADAVSLGTPRYDLGRITLQPTTIGSRAFVGNSAIVPNGTELGDSALVGVLSAPPLDPLESRRHDASWLGSPAIYLPRRAHAGGFKEEETFRPSKRLVALRLFIEFFRVLLPATGFAMLTCLLLTAMTELESWFGLGVAVAVFPALYLAGGVIACLFTAGMKWTLMGRYRPTEKPLWCGFVWRTELVTALHEGLADPWILRMSLGTPLVPLFFRLMGSSIGKGVCMESTWLTEYDLITLGDDVCLGSDCTLQTHLFEDRVMKMSTIRLGRGCSVGTDAVVLYDTRMEEDSSLSDLSLLMKGEELPAHTRWEGSPARLLP
jgi:non-ribosomal peptide synthetase-like protein